MSGGGGDQGFGQTCDAVTICPERSWDGVKIPQVRPPLQCSIASSGLCIAVYRGLPNTRSPSVRKGCIMLERRR